VTHPHFHIDMSSQWQEETVVPFMKWRAGKRLFARGWYVSITLWRMFAVTASFSTQPHTHTYTLSDNAPNIRWEERELAEKRLPDLIVCLRLLFVLHK